MNSIRIISVREEPGCRDRAIDYISSAWKSVPRIIYENSISEAVYAAAPLPQWYLLEKEGRVIGCAGLVTNDFVSRMDLWPWLCALYVDESERGNSYGALLIDKAKEDCVRLGFGNLYLTTGLEGYYEKLGFHYLGTGYHPWDETSQIYALNLRVDALLRDGRYSIAPEREEDYGEIHSFIRTAFETARVKDGDEQNFADNLRKGDDYIPELALTVREGDRLAAHIMLTKTYVDMPGGDRYEGLLIAPVSVAIDYRDKGIGSMLILESMRCARKMGYGAVFLCGDPNYYHRFGFRSVAGFGLTPRTDIPPQYVMCCELYHDALRGIAGSVEFC